MTEASLPDESVPPGIELMRTRSSQRTYRRGVKPDEAAALRSMLGDLPAGPFGGRARIEVMKSGPEGVGTLGTYGVIKGTDTFLVGAISDHARALEDYGFVLEHVILRATALGLGTCWMGGTYRRGQFGRAVGVRPGEVMPAVSPVGQVKGRRSVVDAVFRWAAGSKKRRPWAELFFDGRFGEPLLEQDAGDLRVPLEMVRIAPSASNRQPWRVVRQGRALHLFLHRTLGYHTEFTVDLQRVDIGIGMCHLELAATSLGQIGHWEQLETPEVGPLPPRTEYVVSWLSAPR